MQVNLIYLTVYRAKLFLINVHQRHAMTVTELNIINVTMRLSKINITAFTL